jgi:endonuclease/exonuclease/phosphatase family metal-dependent hydrolase
MKTKWFRRVRSTAALLWLTLGTSLPAAAAVTQLKVMSFNIWVQGGLSLSNCIEVIRSTGADIVGLQECNSTTAQTIGTRLGFAVQPDGDSSIVSRYPIVASIPTTGGRGVTIQLAPGQRVHFFNCHLAAYPYGPYDLKTGRSQSFILDQENQTRVPALTNLLSAMKPYLAGAEPCFLTGDFNAPSHLDYTNFPWPTSVACTNAGLRDSYAETHPNNRKYPGPFTYNEPGITWTPKTDQEPNGVFDRIDFVHYSQGDGVGVSASVEIDQRNSINPWPSDHRAVLTTFTLTPPAPRDKASAPVPPDQASNVELKPTLSWLPGNNALSHTIYFGTSSPGVFFTNTSASSLPLPNLLASTTYFWRIDTLTPSGTVAGDVWSFATKSTNVAIYEWDFSHGDLSATLGHGVLAYADGPATAGLTLFGTTDGTIVPHIEGKPAQYLRAPGFTATSHGYDVTFTDTGPNGGGAYINQYTLIFDVLLPGSVNWVPFFNTNPANANDADFYVNPAGALGISALGYSANGLITANTWFRVAFAADLAAGTVTYYLNGSPVHSSSAGRDGRFSLYSNADAGPDLLLFNEGDASGPFTHEVCLSSFFFTGRTMTAAEILALGGPKARGIATPEPPLRAAILRQGPNLALSWTGGEGPFQIQKKLTLTDPLWQDVGAPTEVNHATIAPSGGAEFFRVVAP